MTDGISFAFWIAALALAFLSGVVKGITGFAMPMILISGLGSFLAPEMALAGLILPTLVTNAWQSMRQGLGAAIASAKAQWRYISIALLCLIVSAQFVTSIPERTLFLVLGIPVTVFAVLQLIGWRPKLDPQNHGSAELGVGAFAGTLGGLSGVWGPPTAMYLTALDTPKLEHVRIQGIVYLTGSIALALSHLNSGILTGAGFKLSAVLIIPAALGLAAGFAVQDRMDAQKFRWAILIVLVVAGLNLIRRGIFG